MRIPLASSLKSRDGTLDQDAKVVNGIVEPAGDAPPTVRRRPGLTDLGLVRVGAAQMLYYWFGKVRSVIGDYLGETTGLGQLVQTTWNSADKDPDVTLSNGDLTISSTGGFARSVLPCTSGVWAWQITVATATGTVCVGMANSSATFTQLGASHDSIAYGGSSGQISKNSSVLATVATYTVSDVIKVVYDFDNTTIAFYKNGTLVYTATGSNVPSGTLYAAAGANSSGGVVHTANFDATSSAANLSPTSAGEQFSAQDNGANSPEALLMIKNSTQAWTIDTSDAVTQITDTDYPGRYAVTLTSLTRSSTTATATTPSDTNFQVGGSVVISGVNEAGWNGTYTIVDATPSSSSGQAKTSRVTIARSGTTATATCIDAPHGLINGQQVEISGADQTGYNGIFTIAVTSTTAFTFTVSVTSQSPATPATGSPALAAGTMAGTFFNLAADDDTFYFSVSSSTIIPANGSAVTIASPSAPSLTGPYTLTSVYAGYVGSFLQLTFTISGYTGPRVLDYSAVVTLASPVSISSITASEGVATVTTGSAHGYTTGSVVTISGATQYQYNGAFSITVTSTTTFTYVLSDFTEGSPATPATGDISAVGVVTVTPATFTFTVDGTETSPATGTITAASGRTTVPGIVYLDGYFVVMDEQGVLYNSDIDAPDVWNPLDYTSAVSESGAGVAIAKSGNYVAAFKEWSTEFFYNAKNAIASPLSPVENGFTLTGCANGWSVANVDGTIMWISQSKKHKGRMVHRMSGTEQVMVSTPDIERVLNADSLATVYAWGARIDGHPCYVLSLVTSGVTLVYDTVSQAWSQWSSYTISASKSISSITRSGTTATVTFGAAHGMSDGDPLTISGATQTDYNGTFQVAYVSTTVVAIEVENSPVTPATGTILGYPYTESYFKLTHYTAADGVDVVLHVSDGHLYEIDPAEAQDDGVPVNFLIRVQRMDGGEMSLKRMARLSVSCDKVADTAMVRWSDDDCATYKPYRRVDMSDGRPNIRRCGAFRERTIEVRHVGDTLPKLTALDLGAAK